MEISVQRLDVLLAVSREGGIQAAADALRVSPSAVSQQIRKLERECGTDLLTRTHSGAVLTEAGKIVVAGAERIESELDRTFRELLEFEGAPTGIVRLASFQTVIRGLVLPNLDTFADVAPGIDLHVREADADAALSAVRRGKADIAVLEFDSEIPRGPRGVKVLPLLQEPWYMVYPSVLADPHDPRELASETWLGVDPETAAGIATTRLAEQWGFTPSAKYVYEDYDVALHMVAAGLGTTVLPKLGLTNLPDGVEARMLPGLGTRRLVLCVSAALSRQSDAIDLTCKVLRQLALSHTEQGEMNNGPIPQSPSIAQA
ncbi:LysR family transcriptional regulator [Trueperella pecoris]|uniref:LysR family transcriptional regulator n=1 Tax=Trueperella pecoris TaxID=2733571 RepID=A0A7M1R0U4_9ACTO|nr:LysR family transcriptional regulator [Trueperella pecoris]QOQ38402.1 LysR family transcriptional regulator [Trueperella pecoris]QOR47155.1 LysR family transcriptional regulator [Trueperella pecoris]QTG75016.1 LysR family transcriptional regulator [Trueperella pecoris]